MMNRSVIGIFLACFALGSAGCMSGTGGDEEKMVNRTIVHLNPDGTKEVKTVVISAAEQAADIEARTEMLARIAEARAQGLGVAEEAISQDTGCAGSSLWLFDSTTTPANEICFHGAGSANLGDYWIYFPLPPYDPGESWSAHVRRYWPGSEAGSLDCTYWVSGTHFTLHETFSAWGSQTNTSTCGSDAQQVTLSN